MCRLLSGRQVSDERLRALIDNSWQSLRVSARGRVSIDPAEVRASPHFKEAQRRIGELVKGSS